MAIIHDDELTALKTDAALGRDAIRFLREMGYWHTRDHGWIHISQMSNSHLCNSIRLLWRRAVKATPPSAGRWIGMDRWDCYDGALDDPYRDYDYSTPESWLANYGSWPVFMSEVERRGLHINGDAEITRLYALSI